MKKEIKEDIRRQNNLSCSQAQYCSNGYISKHNVQIQYNPHQNSNASLHRNRKNNPKMHMEGEKSLNG